MAVTFEKAVEKVRERLGAASAPVEGSFRFDIAEEGTIMIRDGELSTEPGEADVVVRADMDTFQQMFDGELSPAAAFMTGKVEVDGDMGAAMKLSSLLG
mgnify:CR=1 FL=1